MTVLKSHKFVSIIIPALNEEKHIGNCLESIKKLNTSNDFYEVILVDNGSVDRTCDIAVSYTDDLNLKILVVKNVTIAGLRNAGVKYAKGDIFAFLDADCTVSESWLNNAIKCFNDPAVGAAGSSYISPEDSSWVVKTWDINIARKRELGLTTSLPAGNLFVDKEKYILINGFNESLITNEDFDLCFRLQGHGFKIYSDPDIRVIHWGVPNTLGDFYKKNKWHGTHVFKVFISNIKELNNFGAVSYGLYFTLVLIGFISSFLIVFLNYNFVYLMIMSLALILPPSWLSFKTLIKQQASFNYFFKLALLYFIYGIARAHSLLDNLVNIRNK